MIPFIQNSKKYESLSSDRKHISVYLEDGRARRGITKGHRKPLRVMVMFISLTVVMVSLVYTYDKTHPITYFKYAVYYISIIPP